MSYLGTSNLAVLKQVSRVDLGPDKVAFRNPDGTWVSIQPDGSEQTRPHDADPGPWETATVIGPNVVLFKSGDNAYVRYIAE